MIGRAILIAAIAASMGGGTAIAIGPCPRCNATLGDNAARCDTCLRATGREPSLFGHDANPDAAPIITLAESVKALGVASTHATTAATNLAQEAQRLFTNNDLERMAAADAKRARKALKLPKE